MFLFPDGNASPLSVVLYSSTVPAGFPSPADDHVEGHLDLTRLVVRRPAATFFARASGESMIGAGIQDGDLLVVDRSLTAVDGDIVVAVVDGGLTVKQLTRHDAGWILAAANPHCADIPINAEDGVTVWGVVTYSLHRHCLRDVSGLL